MRYTACALIMLLSLVGLITSVFKGEIGAALFFTGAFVAGNVLIRSRA